MQAPPFSIAEFARSILNKPLYPYQLEIAEAILASIFGGQGRLFTVMLARQSGKNQLSAVLEAYLLTFMPGGTIVKAAPTFDPQITHSRLRLLSMLDNSLTSQRIWQSRGRIIGLAPQASAVAKRNQVGPRVMFFSAAPESNIVGATADLLLEIDEAQDVAGEKFDRDLRPMAATTCATTILYGTAWSDRTLLAQQRAVNLERAQSTGERQHFEYDWQVLAALNPAYRRYVEQEITRLGSDHPAIQTQYFLRPLSGAGYFLNTLQHQLLQGTHLWEDAPGSDACYIAAMDVAGEERPTSADLTVRRTQRDSSVITIGRVSYNSFDLPVIEVVHHVCWTGMPYLEQYAATVNLVERWGVRTFVIDATGLGAPLASLLRERLGAHCVRPFLFTRPSKSQLAYQLVALINSGRLKLYTPTAVPVAIFEQLWQQLRLARCRIPAPDTLDIYVDPADGHDDFLISLALLTSALASLTSPALSTFVAPLKIYTGESKF
jgi:hypothetical protein